MAQSLPQALDEQEQKQLLNLYYESRDEDVRQKLLEHNLRLCVKAAIEVCSLYGLKDMLDQAFSICYEELSNSLDRFDPNQTSSFASYAYSNMKLQMMSHLENERYKTYPIIDSEVAVVAFSEGEEAIDIFDHLSDADESAMPQNVASDLFVEDITKFINNAKWSDQRRDIVKMYLGLESARAYSKIEIANELKLSRQRISQLLDASLPLIQNYISENYTQSFPDAKPLTPLKFENIDERNLYIFESYYGLNGKSAKSAERISKEVCVGTPFVRTIAKKYKFEYEKTHNAKLSHTRIPPDVYYEAHKDDIFNDYYGLNGSKSLTTHEIIAKYNLTMNAATLSSLLSQMSQDAIEGNKYSQEQIAEIRHNRYKKQKIQELAKIKYVYCSYYCLDGHEPKRKFQLAQEFGVAQSTIEGWLNKYKKYLENHQSSEESTKAFE